MKTVRFPEVNLVIAENQPEYVTMPVNYDRERGTATICWSLSWKEILVVLFTGRIWHTVMTFGMSMQPQMVSATKPEMKK